MQQVTRCYPLSFPPASRTGLVARRLCRCARHTGHSLSSPCLLWGCAGRRVSTASTDCLTGKQAGQHTRSELLLPPCVQVCQAAAVSLQTQHNTPARDLGAQVLLDALGAVAVQAGHADARAANLACRKGGRTDGCQQRQRIFSEWQWCNVVCAWRVLRGGIWAQETMQTRRMPPHALAPPLAQDAPASTPPAHRQPPHQSTWGSASRP